VPRLCELYPGICLTTEGKAQETLSQGSDNSIIAELSFIKFDIGKYLPLFTFISNPINIIGVSHKEFQAFKRASTANADLNVMSRVKKKKKVFI
jgi:hypothetical protein